MDGEEQFVEQPRRRAIDEIPMPVTNQEQLGQFILQTTARISDPDMIEFRTIKKKFPVVETKTILNERGKETEVEVVTGYEDHEWEVPVRVQSEYHEMISDDIAKAFLSPTDYILYQDTVDYCLMIRSFAKRYDLNLAIHFNNFVDGLNAKVAASGAVKGRRVMIAKSNIAETTYREENMRLEDMRNRDKKKKKLFGVI